MEPWLHIAWKYLYTAKDSRLGATANLGAIGAMYNLTMDPYERYDTGGDFARPGGACTCLSQSVRPKPGRRWPLADWHDAYAQPVPSTSILAGSLPYFAFSVLYDAGAQRHRLEATLAAAAQRLAVKSARVR